MNKLDRLVQGGEMTSPQASLQRGEGIYTAFKSSLKIALIEHYYFKADRQGHATSRHTGQ
jgi:hypothetical protein